MSSFKHPVVSVTNACMAKHETKGLTTPKGFQAAAGSCGIKPSGQPDLALIVADHPCAAAGVFTTSRTPSPPVVIGRQHLRSGRAQAIVCNSGISNALTGPTGQQHAHQMCQQVAQCAPIKDANPRLVIASSTGVIGTPLPIKKITHQIKSLAQNLARGKRTNAMAAQAIMTTDLVPKHAYRMIKLPTATVHIGGICKGSGMIAPNMATMLTFITTDVDISPALLKTSLKQAVDQSFNRISIDQHTSPSDMVIILASGQAGNPIINRSGDHLKRFQNTLTEICKDMAYQIVKDGEGATKVFRVNVTGAKNQPDADRVGQAIVDSPLVKTAVHGGDPNWGRIVTAAGYSHTNVQPEQLSLTIEQTHSRTKLKPRICVFKRGKPVVLTARTKQKLQRIMASREITFTIHLGVGKAQTQWLGCDLSKQYVTINAEYTT